MHSLPKIMPVLWAKPGWVIVLFLGQNTLFSQYLSRSRSKDGYHCNARETCDEVLGGGGGTLQWTCFMLCKLGWASLHGSLSSTTDLRLTNTFFQLVTFITRVHPSFTLSIIIYSFSLLCLHQTFLTIDNH